MDPGRKGRRRGLRVALIGNQNCGKTTLFNALTGAHQHVGNFPGVTVEKKEGTLRGCKDIYITDLPGVYSLTPYTAEEKVTRDFLLKEKPDMILNILDATNIERNLYLSVQVLEWEIPTILTLNFMDEIRSGGGQILCREMERRLGVPVIPISALKGEGMEELIRQIRKGGTKPSRPVMDRGSVGQTLQKVREMTAEKAKTAGWPAVFMAECLLRGTGELTELPELTEKEVRRLRNWREDLERQYKTDVAALLADRRYHVIEELCRDCVIKPQYRPGRNRTYAMDRWLTHRYLGIPIFIIIIGFIFQMTFQGAGAWLRKGMEYGVEQGTRWLAENLERIGTASWLRSLIIEGICGGVGSVLSFLPVILILFFFLSLLEDSGYMARVAFVMDRPMEKIGLSGRSFVPLLLGFGCSVPAIMAARTLSSERDRRMTIRLIPFVSCTAKLPIYGLLCQTFFPECAGWAMLGVYGVGLASLVLTGWLMNTTRYRGRRMPFVLELPDYRFPDARNLFLHMKQRAEDFLQKVFSTVLIASVAVWFLGHFNRELIYVMQGEESLLAEMGRLLAPVFGPLGFGDWRAATALITGLMAKESVVSTLTVLTGAVSGQQLAEALRAMLSPAGAVSFLVFTALYMPCIAAFGACRKELSGRLAVRNSLFQTATAYGAAALLYFAAVRLL